MHVESGVVAVVDVRVEHRRAEVVSRGDRVHVASQVKVEQLHGHDLAVAASGSTSLDPEGRPH